MPTAVQTQWQNRTSEIINCSMNNFTEQDGFLGGGALLVVNMTVADAQTRCCELEGCTGFTFKENPNKSLIEIYFKNGTDVNADGHVGWKTREKPEQNTESQHTIFESIW